jgi:hypothetical protein
VVPPGFEAACGPAGAEKSLPIAITYTHGATAVARRARLEITVEGDPVWKTGPKVVELRSQLGKPQIKCSPTALDFGKVEKGQGGVLPLKCANAGTGELVVEKLIVDTVDMPLQVTIEGGPIVSPDAPFAGTPKLAVAAGQAMAMTITLKPIPQAEKLNATLRIHSNDAAAPLTSVPVRANTTGPCLKVSTPVVDFGGVPVGGSGKREVLLESCGTEEVQVTSLAVDPASAPGFVAEAFGCAPAAGKVPSQASPLLLAPNAKCTFYITFSPQAVGQVAQGKVVVKGQADIGAEVQLAGSGVTAACPAACVAVKNKATSAKIAPGGAVIPQTEIVLDAACSTAPAPHVIASWNWTVSQPNFSFSLLKPSSKSKQVSFQPNLAGKYTFTLDVADDAGNVACKPAVFELIVVPDDMVHVELTWDTPGDPDKTDEGQDPITKQFVGSDMDLHTAHDHALQVAGQKDLDKNGEPDPWWAPGCDCFWFAKKPKWGDAGDLDDDPRLDRDDTDGWGPENLNIKVPEKGRVYHLGVHYSADSKFGVSTPRVRVFLDASLQPQFDLLGPVMATNDLWCVGRVSWQPNKLEPCKGADATGKLLTKNYPQPAPKIGTCP